MARQKLAVALASALAVRLAAPIGASGVAPLAAWDEGAEWKERWRIDDAEAELYQDVGGLTPSTYGTPWLATGGTNGYAAAIAVAVADLTVYSVQCVYSGPVDFGECPVIFGPVNEWNANNRGLYINTDGTAYAGSTDPIFTPNGYPVADLNVGVVLSGGHRRVWHNRATGKVWIGNDDGPASGDPQAGTGEHFTCAPGSKFVLGVYLIPDTSASIERTFDDGAFTASNAIWSRASGDASVAWGDPVRFIGDTYGEGALVLPGSTAYPPRFDLLAGSDAKFLQLYYDVSSDPPDYLFETPAAMVGLEVDFAYRSPVGGCFAGTLVLGEFMPHLVAQEIIVRYPSNPAAHALMVAFLEEHNTITYHDAITIRDSDNVNFFYVGSWYVSYTGGNYGVISNGDGTITLGALGTDLVIGPDFSPDTYAGVTGLSFGDFVDVTANNPDELIDFSLSPNSGKVSAACVDFSTLTQAEVFSFYGLHGFLPPAVSWPPVAKVVNLGGAHPISIMGRGEDLDFANAACKETVELFVMSLASISGLLDFRGWSALESVWMSLIIGGELSLNFHDVTTLIDITPGFSNLVSLDLGGCSSMLAPPALPPTLRDLDIVGTTFFTDASQLDNLLIELDGFGLSNGVLNIMAGRTSASDAAVAAMLGRGYTVNEADAPGPEALPPVTEGMVYYNLTPFNHNYVGTLPSPAAAADTLASYTLTSPMPGVTGVIPDMSMCTSLTDLYLNGCGNLTAFGAIFPGSLVNLSNGGSAFDEAAVDAFLASCVSSGLSGTSIFVQCTPSQPPSAAGLVSKAALEGAGCTVTVDS